jgi:hypothetical protein
VAYIGHINVCLFMQVNIMIHAAIDRLPYYTGGPSLWHRFILLG